MILLQHLFNTGDVAFEHFNHFPKPPFALFRFFGQNVVFKSLLAHNLALCSFFETLTGT